MAYFKSDGKFIYLDAPYAEFYIPDYYFKNNAFAEDYGSKIRGIGVFDVGFFDSNQKLTEMRVLNLPTWADFFVTDSEFRNVSLPNDETTTQKCKVIKYIKGEKITNASIVQNSSYSEKFANFVLQGKIPSIVPYDESIKLWIDNQEINGVNLGVPAVIEELILSSAYRYKENPSIKFAHVYGKDKNVDAFDYVMKRVREICQYTSTFTALTFEDMNSMITTSLNRTRNKGTEAFSPLEDILKL